MMRWAGVLLFSTLVFGDGKVVPKREYKGSLEERAQEAILIFHEGVQDTILKITVTGSADAFAWVIPFPSEPTTHKADPKLFRELFDYVQSRRRRTSKGGKGDAVAAEAEPKVKVLSRKVVGSYDVAVVAEKKAGALNRWLDANGYRSLDGAEDVLAHYRKKGYVFACIRISDAARDADEPVDIHPLRFRFKTGGKDGIYFPMKLTGLQNDPFDVNLYVFYRYWINGRLSKYGYTHRGFHMRHRDWDSQGCKPNGGKDWARPEGDVYLRGSRHLFPTVTKLMQETHAGRRFYLTNIAGRFRPGDVRGWKDDLWLFPYYTNRDFVPHDARADGPAAGWYR